MCKVILIQKRLLPILLITLIGFMCINSIEVTFGSTYYLSSNYDRIYNFDIENKNYQFRYKMHLSVPPTLHDYYQRKSHSLNGDREYSKFITPNAVKNIAEKIQNHTINKPNNKEEFTNAVLAFVRQIPYAISNRKYPVETIVDNSGDCDTLSFLTASIMKAGNLEIVLFLYRDLPVTHMNIGVHLPNTPIFEDHELSATGYEFNNKTYWVAECTPSGNWKVGIQPSSFSNSTPYMISIENPEKAPPADISASLFRPLNPSKTSITISSRKVNVTSKYLPLIISGSIWPAYSGKNVTVYVRRSGSFYETFPVITGAKGRYSLTWNGSSFGIYYIKTSLTGFSGYAGSDSETITVYVGNSEPNEPYATYGSRNYKIFYNNNINDVLINNFTGSNVSFSGEFILLNNGSMSDNNQETILYPEKIIKKGKIRLFIPEQSITIKESKQENNYFGFFLKNEYGNFNANLQIFNEEDLHIIEKKFEANDTMIQDLSDRITESTWYKIVINITNNCVATELKIENSTLYNTFLAKEDSKEISELGIIISCQADNIIAFKNLKVESLNQQYEQPTANISILINEFKQNSKNYWLLTSILSILILLLFLKRKKQ